MYNLARSWGLFFAGRSSGTQGGREEAKEKLSDNLK